MKRLKYLLPAVLILTLLIGFFAPAQPVYAATVTVSVSASTDDAVRRLTASFFILDDSKNIAGRSSAGDKQWGSGMRFQNITVPQGAGIITAYLTLTSGTTSSGTVANTRISAEDIDDAPTFINDSGVFDTRWANRTTARVNWDGIGTWTLNAEYDSPEIKTVIQEIIDRPGWNSGQDIVIFWDDFEDRSTGTSRKEAWSWDEGDGSKAPELYIEYGLAAVTTNAASLEEETTATLNANLDTLGGFSPVYVYFQYGLTAGYGIDTIEQSRTGTGAYSQAIADLSPGTEYHFRAAVKYDTSYVYGNDTTFDTKPLGVTNVSATTGDTSVTLTWTKGTGSDTTVIRRGTTDFPATPTSGDSVYTGTGVEVIDDTLITNQAYYYSLWAKSDAAVYSDAYSTLIATPSSDILSPPDILDIIDVKVFSNYFEPEDQVYVIRYKILYDAGDPTQDASDFFNFELLDGTALKAQVPVIDWGYLPGSIYQSTLSAPTWGGSYTVRLKGSDMAWGTPPETSWNLTPGDWIGDDMDQLDTWVITMAEAMQAYYGVEMVSYVTGGRPILTDRAGTIFSLGISGLYSVRPNLFSLTPGYPDIELETDRTKPVEEALKATSEGRIGPYIWGLLEAIDDLIPGDFEPREIAGAGLALLYLVLALTIGAMSGNMLWGLSASILVFGPGVYFGVITLTMIALIAFVSAVLFAYQIFWKRT